MHPKIILPVLVLLFTLSTFLIIRSNIFAIKSVDVQSEKIGCADNNQIKDFSRLLGQNFLFINSSETEKMLKKKFICIKSIAISKYFPDKLSLHISGREPIAILVVEKSKEATESGLLERFSEVAATPSAEVSSPAIFNLSPEGQTENFLIDSEGVIYSQNIEQINAPKVYISGIEFLPAGRQVSLGQNINEDLIGNTLKILEKVKVFGVDVKEAKIYPENILLVNAAAKIIFRLDNIDTQIASLQLILQKAKIDEVSVEFIDLRFDKPVVKFAPKKN